MIYYPFYILILSFTTIFTIILSIQPDKAMGEKIGHTDSNNLLNLSDNGVARCLIFDRRDLHFLATGKSHFFF